MSTVANDTVARVFYTGKFEDGEIFDTNQGGEPLTFLVGHKKMISGFEEELMGASIGDERTFKLAPNRAYGERMKVCSKWLTRVSSELRCPSRLECQVMLRQREGA